VVLAQQAPPMGHTLTVWFTWMVLLGVPALLFVIIWMRRFGGSIALPREHVPLRQRLQHLRDEMRARSAGELPPPLSAPGPEPPSGRRFAVGIVPDHAAAQAQIASFEPDGLAEHTEFPMVKARAFVGYADAFCAQADRPVHRPGVAPAALRGMFESADRFGELGPGLNQATKGRPEHWIETVADVARLTDAQVDELEQVLRADCGGGLNGDVARWREHARQLLTEETAAADEPLATFVVEARKPADGPGGEPRFAVHHIEADENSAPLPAVDEVAQWIRERVTMPFASPATKTAAGAAEVARASETVPLAPSPPQHPARRGRLRITGLEIRRADGRAVNGTAESLSGDAPVLIEAGCPLVFVTRVGMEGATDPVACHVRCRLQPTEPGEVFEFTWSGKVIPSGVHSAEMSSAPVSVPVGVYRGVLFAEDQRRSIRRAFRELPLLVVN
jgi:hypothetical protein